MIPKGKNKKSNNDELIAIFDIESGSVGGALVKIPKKSKKAKEFNLPALGMLDKLPQSSEIIHAVRTPISMSQDFDFDFFLFEMGRALAETAKNLENARLGAPNKVFCFLASPWHASQTRIIKMNKNTPFVFSAKISGELLRKEIKNFENAQTGQSLDLGKDFKIIESSVMQIKLNGYKTSDPFGKKAKELEMAVFVSVSPENILSAIEHRIQKFFNMEVKFQSSLFSSFVVARDAFPSESDFIFSHIGGEITDLVKVSGEILVESVSFPIGRNFLKREVEKNLNFDDIESLSLLKLYLRGEAHKNISDKMDKILNIAGEEWRSSLENSLNKMLGENPLPSRFFLIADEDMSSWFKKTVQGEQLHQYTVTENKFDVTIFRHGKLGDLCKVREGALRDPFLMAESIFINKI